MTLWEEHDRHGNYAVGNRKRVIMSNVAALLSRIAQFAQRQPCGMSSHPDARMDRRTSSSLSARIRSILLHRWQKITSTMF